VPTLAECTQLNRRRAFDEATAIHREYSVTESHVVRIMAHHKHSEVPVEFAKAFENCFSQFWFQRTQRFIEQ
jgi:hypothetical protein